MNKIYILISILLFTGCSMTKLNKITGTYKSSCILYTEPSAIITFNIDNSFIYDLPFGESASGTWILKTDTLMLHSEKFQTTDPLAPTYKYTDLEGKKDVFLIKKQKLYPCNKEGCTKTCFLKKQK